MELIRFNGTGDGVIDAPVLHMDGALGADFTLCGRGQLAMTMKSVAARETTRNGYHRLQAAAYRRSVHLPLQIRRTLLLVHRRP